MGSQNAEKIATMVEKLQTVSEDIREIKQTLKQEYITKIEFASLRALVKEIIVNQRESDNRYVTKEEFRPFKRAFNVVGGVILTAITGALASLVIRQP